MESPNALQWPISTPGFHHRLLQATRPSACRLANRFNVSHTLLCDSRNVSSDILVRFTEAQASHPPDPSRLLPNKHAHLDAVRKKDKVRNRGHVTGVRELGRLVDIGCGHSYGPV